MDQTLLRSVRRKGDHMKDAKRTAVVLGVIVVIVLSIALQVAAFAGPLPAPAPEDRGAL